MEHDMEVVWAGNGWMLFIDNEFVMDGFETVEHAMDYGIDWIEGEFDGV